MRKKLKRDLQHEELARVEEAARTEEDFEKLEKEWWDRLDANRERKERYHEQKFDINMFEWDIFTKRMKQSKDFFNDFFMCICEMHNLIDDPEISRLLNEATDKQKAVFFPRVIVGCSTEKISKCHEMTDRNVRKLIDLMLDNIRVELYEIFLKRLENGEYLVYEQRQFLLAYKDLYEQKKKEKEEKAAIKADKKTKKAKKDKKIPVEKIINE